MSADCPMNAARSMVILGGVTAMQAAKKVGISPSSIYKAQWYKEHKKRCATAAELSRTLSGHSL